MVVGDCGGGDVAQHKGREEDGGSMYMLVSAFFHILICPALLLDSFDLIVPARSGLKA